MRRSVDAIRRAYEHRGPLLQELAQSLQSELLRYLKDEDVPHVDRVHFRCKGVESFVDKAISIHEDGSYKYAHPFEEIEDQVAGRVLVFYRPDIEAVLRALEGKWPKAEQEHRCPAKASQFDYETTHRICVITADQFPPGWSQMERPPTTFELQIRTLAQHAWAEPQHAFYKNKGGLDGDSERKLYWAAASAWGMDSIWEQLADELRHIDHE